MVMGYEQGRGEAYLDRSGQHQQDWVLAKDEAARGSGGMPPSQNIFKF